MMRRRRPLARAAMVGGAAYYAGKKGQQASQREQEQRVPPRRAGGAAAAAAVSDAPPAAPAAPTGLTSEAMAQLQRLAQLKESGVLTEEEFESEAQASGDDMSTPGTRSPRDRPLFGPVQMLVVGFDKPEFTGKVLARVQAPARARHRAPARPAGRAEDDAVRSRCTSRASRQDEAMEFGAYIRRADRPRHGRPRDGRGRRPLARPRSRGRSAAIDEDTVWYVADTIPNGSAAAIALIRAAGRSRSATRSSRPVASRSPTSGSIPRI